MYCDTVKYCDGLRLGSFVCSVVCVCCAGALISASGGVSAIYQ